MGFAALYPSYVPETSMDKIDFKKKLATLYNAPNGSFATVDVPVMKFVKIDGKGYPNRDPAYKAAIEWLYSVSYAMKFAAKTKSAKDYVVPPLEGLWWADNPDDFAGRRKQAMDDDDHGARLRRAIPVRGCPGKIAGQARGASGLAAP